MAGAAGRGDIGLRGDAAGAARPTSDSAGSSASSGRSLCWQLGEQWAIREGPFKLVHSRVFWNDPALATGLYDLEADPAETRDLSAERPERVNAMIRAQRAWRADL